MDFFVQNMYIAILFPLWVSLLILIGKFTATLKSKKTILILTLISSIWGLISSAFVFGKVALNQNFTYESTIQFLSIQNLNFELGYYVDLLSTFMALIVFAVTLIVQIYAYFYMKEDKSFVRFFTYFNFFLFAMIGLVFSPNMFQTYIFWELVGVASYLLIGFWYKKNSAQLAAKKAFLMNRIGDCCLLAGLIFSSVILFNFAPDVSVISIPFSNLDEISSLLYTYTTEITFGAICVLFFFGSIAKSAQFPLHTWLVDAMEGPTPVSALIHSATMVAAGVYLVARLYPIYYQSAFAMNFITCIGIITAIICAYFALTRIDIKKVLAYSTSSQLGIMFVALGSGALTGGVIYLSSHAFIKSMLFLCAGAVMKALADNTDIRNMGCLRKSMPTVAYSFLIGAFALSGLMFSGFATKSVVFHQLFSTSNILVLSLLILVSFMTTFYIFRLYFLVFEGKSEKSINYNKKYGFNIPIIISAIIIIILGFFYPNLNEIKLDIIPVSIEILALILAFCLYKNRRALPKVPVLYKFSYNALYIDSLYDFIAKRVYSLFTTIAQWIDDYIFDGLVYGIAFLARLKSWLCSKMQTGNLQSYLSYAFLIIALLFTCFCIVYSLVAYFIEV